MEFEGPEALLQRMAEVGVAPLDNQAVANSLGRGFESFALSGKLPGQESLISDDLLAAMPEAEPAPKVAAADPEYTFANRLPGLA